MSKAISDLRKRLATELKTKKQALKDLQLKDLIAIYIPYSKVFKGNIRNIATIYLDKYLESFENISVIDEIKKNPGQHEEIVDLFCFHELDIEDEKQKVAKQLSVIIRKKFMTRTGGIDWHKLTQFNSGNYNPNSELK